MFERTLAALISAVLTMAAADFLVTHAAFCSTSPEALSTAVSEAYEVDSDYELIQTLTCDYEPEIDTAGLETVAETL